MNSPKYQNTIKSQEYLKSSLNEYVSFLNAPSKGKGLKCELPSRHIILTIHDLFTKWFREQIPITSRHNIPTIHDLLTKWFQNQVQQRHENHSILTKQKSRYSTYIWMHTSNHTFLILRWNKHINSTKVEDEIDLLRRIIIRFNNIAF